MRTARSSAPPAAPNGTFGSGWLPAALIVVAVALAYVNTLTAPFIFDDGPGIELNQSIRHLWPLGPVLQPPSERGSGVAGRPVVNLTLAVNHAISGLNPWSYHAANVLIHALAALTLFGLVRAACHGPVLRERLGAQAGPVAFAVALLWALHPLQTESVTCIIQRTESLVGLFYLFTLYAFARAATAESRRGNLAWAGASVAACALGMATKEVMVTAPVIALLFDRTFLSGDFKGVWRRRALHYGLIATWALLFYLMQGNPLRGGTAGYDAITPWQYLLTQCRAVVLYLKLAVWPHPLVLDYGTDYARSIGEVWPQAVLLVGLAGATGWALVRRPVLGFLGAWWFVILAPSSSLVPLVTQTVAEHRVYLPLAALVALGVGTLATRAAPRLLPACGVVALLFGGLTLARNQLYRTPDALWRDNLAHCPDTARAWVALAAVADRAERYADAVYYYEEYMRHKPDDALVEFNLARDLVKTDRRAEALPHYQNIVRRLAGDPEMHINYGAALIGAGRFPEAVQQYEAVLRLRRGVANDQFNLAEALRKAGRQPEALPHYAQAIALEPESGLMHFRHGDALLNAGRPAEAVEAYQTAVKLRPDLRDAWTNLGGCFLMLGRIEEAIGAYEAALRLKPDDPASRRNLDFARRQRRR